MEMLEYLYPIQLPIGREEFVMIRTTIVGYGETHLRLIETYIYRLDNYLSAYYPGISWNVHNALLKGATTVEMLRNLKDKVLIHNPNVVFISISSNDSCNASNKLIGLKEFEENLTEILRLVRAHNNRTGLNGCMPIPVFITPSAVNEAVTGVSRTNNRLKQYIYIVKELAKKQKCPIVDLFGVMQNKENYLDYIGEDGYTINQKGHDLLYDLVFLELIKLINYQGVLKDRDIVADELRY
ncbi:MAG: hypothetical protein K0S30_2131 [Clostridia bacterium]|jgi:lysophospholipase L1-like esterase|nr:hypothetical protein [Clostridia bacterium]